MRQSNDVSRDFFACCDVIVNCEHFSFAQINGTGSLIDPCNQEIHIMDNNNKVRLLVCQLPAQVTLSLFLIIVSFFIVPFHLIIP